MEEIIEIGVKLPKIDISEFQPVLDVFKQVDTAMSTFSENIEKTTQELDGFSKKGEKQFSGLTAQARGFSAEVSGIRENVASGSKEFEGMIKHYNDMYEKADAADDQAGRARANEYGQRVLERGRQRSSFASSRAHETIAIGDALGLSEGVRERSGIVTSFEPITPYLDIKSQEAALRSYNADLQRLMSKWAPTISATINGAFNGGRSDIAVNARGAGNNAKSPEQALEHYEAQIGSLVESFFSGKQNPRDIKFNPAMVRDFSKLGADGTIDAEYRSAVARMIDNAVRGRVGPSSLPGVKQMLGGADISPVRSNIQQFLSSTAFSGIFDKGEQFGYRGRDVISAMSGMSFTPAGLTAITKLAQSNPIVANALLASEKGTGSGSAGRAAYRTAGMGHVLNVSKVGDLSGVMDDLAKNLLIGLNGTSEATLSDGSSARLLPELMSERDASGKKVSTYSARTKYGLGGKTDTLIDTIAGDLAAKEFEAMPKPEINDYPSYREWKKAMADFNAKYGGHSDTGTAQKAYRRIQQNGVAQTATRAATELLDIITNPEYTTTIDDGASIEIPFNLDASARGRSSSFIIEKLAPFKKGVKGGENTAGLTLTRDGKVTPIKSTWGPMDENGFTRVLGLGYADRGETTDLIKEIDLSGMEAGDEDAFRQLLIDTGVAYKDEEGNIKRKKDSEYVFHATHGQSGVSARLIKRDAYEKVEKEFAEKFSIPYAKRYGMIDSSLEGDEAIAAAQAAVGTFWNNMAPESDTFGKIPELAKAFDNRNKRWSPGIDFRGGAIDWLNGGKDIYGNEMSFESILARVTGSSSSAALDAGGRTPRTALLDFAPLWQKLGGAAKYGFESGSEGQAYINEEFAQAGSYQGRGGFAGKGIFGKVKDMARLLAEASGEKSNITTDEESNTTYSIQVPSGYDNTKMVTLTSTYNKDDERVGGNFDAFIDASVQKDAKTGVKKIYKTNYARLKDAGMLDEEASAEAERIANEALSVQYAVSPDYIMNRTENDSSTGRIGKQAAQWMRFSPYMMKHQGEALSERINQVKTISGMAQLFGGEENPNSYFAQGLSGLDPNFIGDVSGFYYANQDAIDEQVNNYIVSLQKRSANGEFINHDNKLEKIDTLGNRVKTETQTGIDNERLVTNPWTALLSTYGITQDPEARKAWAGVIDSGMKSLIFDDKGKVAEGALAGMTADEIKHGRQFIVKAQKEFEKAKGSKLTGDQTMGILSMTGYGKEGDVDYLPAGYVDFEHKNQIDGAFVRSPTGFNQIAGGVNYGAIGYGRAFSKLSGQKDGVLFNFGDMQRLAGADWDGDMIKALTSGKYSIENIPGLEGVKDLKGKEKDQFLLNWMRNGGYAKLREGGKIGGTAGSIVDDALNTIELLDNFGLMSTDDVEERVRETRKVTPSTESPTGDLARDLSKDAIRRLGSPFLMARTSGIGSRLSGLDLTDKSMAFWAQLALESNKLYDVGTTIAKKPHTYKLTAEDWTALNLGPEFAKAAEFLDGRFAVRGDKVGGYTRATGAKLSAQDVFDYNGVAMDISGSDTGTGFFERVGKGGMKIDTFQLLSRTNKSQLMGSLAAQILKQQGNFDSSVGEATKEFITADAEYKKDKQGNLILDDNGNFIRTGGGLGFGLADSLKTGENSYGLEKTRRMLKNFRSIFALQTNGNQTLMSERTRDILDNQLAEARKEIDDYSEIAGNLDPTRWIKKTDEGEQLMSSKEIRKELYKEFGIAGKEMAVSNQGHQVDITDENGKHKTDYLTTAMTVSGLLDLLVGNAYTTDEKGNRVLDERKLAEAKQTARMMLSTYDFNETDTGIVDDRVENYRRRIFSDTNRVKENAELLGVSDIIPEDYYKRQTEINSYTEPVKEEVKVAESKPEKTQIENEFSEPKKTVEERREGLKQWYARVAEEREKRAAKEREEETKQVAEVVQETKDAEKEDEKQMTEMIDAAIKDVTPEQPIIENEEPIPEPSFSFYDPEAYNNLEAPLDPKTYDVFYDEKEKEYKKLAVDKEEFEKRAAELMNPNPPEGLEERLIELEVSHPEKGGPDPNSPWTQRAEAIEKERDIGIASIAKLQEMVKDEEYQKKRTKAAKKKSKEKATSETTVDTTIQDTTENVEQMKLDLDQFTAEPIQEIKTSESEAAKEVAETVAENLGGVAEAVEEKIVDELSEEEKELAKRKQFEDWSASLLTEEELAQEAEAQQVKINQGFSGIFGSESEDYETAKPNSKKYFGSHTGGNGTLDEVFANALGLNDRLNGLISEVDEFDKFHRLNNKLDSTEDQVKRRTELSFDNDFKKVKERAEMAREIYETPELRNNPLAISFAEKAQFSNRNFVEQMGERLLGKFSKEQNNINQMYGPGSGEKYIENIRKLESDVVERRTALQKTIELKNAIKNDDNLKGYLQNTNSDDITYESIINAQINNAKEQLSKISDSFIRAYGTMLNGLTSALKDQENKITQSLEGITKENEGVFKDVDKSVEKKMADLGTAIGKERTDIDKAKNQDAFKSGTEAYNSEQGRKFREEVLAREQKLIERERQFGNGDENSEAYQMLKAKELRERGKDAKVQQFNFDAEQDSLDKTDQRIKRQDVDYELGFLPNVIGVNAFKKNRQRYEQVQYQVEQYKALENKYNAQATLYGTEGTDTYDSKKAEHYTKLAEQAKAGRESAEAKAAGLTGVKGLLGTSAKMLGSDALKKASEKIKKIFKELVKAALEFNNQWNSAMAGVAAKSGLAGKELEAVGDKIEKQATKLKISSVELAKTYKELFSAGFNTSNIEQAAEAVTKFATVTGQKATAAVKQLAQMVNSGLVESMNQAMDMLTAVSDKSVASAADISKVLTKMSAIATGTGMSSSEAMSLATFASEALGGSSSVGNDLGVILSRLTKISMATTSTKEENVYTDDEGRRYDIASLRSLEKSTGVSILNDDKSYMRDPYAILEEVASKWAEMNDAQRNAFTNILGGSTGRQANTFMSLMNAWSLDPEKMQEYLTATQNSEGLVNSQYAAQTNTIASAKQQAKSAFTDIVSDIFGGSDGWFNSLQISFYEGIANALSSSEKKEIDLTDVIDFKTQSVESYIKSFEKIRDKYSDVSDTLTKADTNAIKASIEGISKAFPDLAENADIAVTSVADLVGLLDMLIEKKKELAGDKAKTVGMDYDVDTLIKNYQSVYKQAYSQTTDKTRSMTMSTAVAQNWADIWDNQVSSDSKSNFYTYLNGENGYWAKNSYSSDKKRKANNEISKFVKAIADGMSYEDAIKTYSEGYDEYKKMADWIYNKSDEDILSEYFTFEGNAAISSLTADASYDETIKNLIEGWTAGYSGIDDDIKQKMIDWAKQKYDPKLLALGEVKPSFAKDFQTEWGKYLSEDGTVDKNSYVEDNQELYSGYYYAKDENGETIPLVGKTAEEALDWYEENYGYAAKKRAYDKEYKDYINEWMTTNQVQYVPGDVEADARRAAYKKAGIDEDLTIDEYVAKYSDKKKYNLGDIYDAETDEVAALSIGDILSQSSLTKDTTRDTELKLLQFIAQNGSDALMDSIKDADGNLWDSAAIENFFAGKTEIKAIIDGLKSGDKQYTVTSLIDALINDYYGGDVSEKAQELESKIAEVQKLQSIANRLGTDYMTAEDIAAVREFASIDEATWQSLDTYSQQRYVVRYKDYITAQGNQAKIDTEGLYNQVLENGMFKNIFEAKNVLDNPNAYDEDVVKMASQYSQVYESAFLNGATRQKQEDDTYKWVLPDIAATGEANAILSATEGNKYYQEDNRINLRKLMSAGTNWQSIDWGADKGNLTTALMGQYSGLAEYLDLLGNAKRTEDEEKRFQELRSSLYQESYTALNDNQNEAVGNELLQMVMDGTLNTENADYLTHLNEDYIRFISYNEEAANVLEKFRKGEIGAAEAADKLSKSMKKDAAATDSFNKSALKSRETLSNIRYYLDKKKFNKNKNSDEGKELMSLLGIGDETLKNMTDDEIRRQLESSYGRVAEEYQDNLNEYASDMQLTDAQKADFAKDQEITLGGITLKAGGVQTFGIDEAISLAQAMGQENIVAELESLKAMHGEISLETTTDADGTIHAFYNGVEIAAGQGRKSSSSSGGGKSASAKLIEKWKRELSIDKHQINMVKAQETKYQQAGNLASYGNMVELENVAQTKQIGKYQKAIKELKKQMGSVKKNSDDWYDLRDAVFEYEEAIEECKNTIAANTKALKENREAMRQTRTELENMIKDAIEANEKFEEDKLAGTVNMQDTVLNALKERYQAEWDLMKQDLEKKKAALEEEKNLINERLQARKDAESEASEYEQLAELQKQLALISMDSTMSKEAADLRSQIAEKQNALAWKQAEESTNAMTEALDEQIGSIDQYMSEEDERVAAYLEDANNFANQVAEVLGMSSDEIMTWLADNVEEYGNLLDAAQKQQVESWLDTYKQMMGITDLYWTEIEAIVSGGWGNVMSYMQTTQEYQNASATGKLEQIYKWQTAFDNYTNAFEGTQISKAYDEYMAIIEKAVDSGDEDLANKYLNGYIELMNGSAKYSHTDTLKASDGTVTYKIASGTEHISANTDIIVSTLKNVDKLANLLNSDLARYATGGINTSTGIAWLDGTEANPEYIFTSDQMKAMMKTGFIPLSTQIGSDMFNGSSSTMGDVIVTINQAEISSDYDVERLASLVGDKFVEQISTQGYRTSRF